MALPERFCWTRFGTEAGEQIGQILARKEVERVANGGMFLWGIGNALGPSMRQLVSLEAAPEAVFSPIRSAPRREDVMPDIVVRWTAARTMEGDRYHMPSGSLVTSRAKYRVRRETHYALVCASSVSLQIDVEGESLAFNKLRNLATGRPVGASQVTAIVRHAGDAVGTDGIYYRAALRVHLVYPYFVELIDPVPANIERLPSASGSCPEPGIGAAAAQARQGRGA